MKLNVYIDGFNLYYGSLKSTPYKWLNVRKMSELLFPGSTIHRIKYFTARVIARPHDPGQPIRQNFYFRALKTLPNLEIIEGQFLVSYPRMSLAANPANRVQVIKTEEKGSDVNMAVHLLNDGYKKEYDSAVIITNDSDLAEAMRIVQTELKLKVGIANSKKRPAFKLKQQASFIKQIRKGVLTASQFPETLTDKQGNFHKPKSW